MAVTQLGIGATTALTLGAPATAAAATMITIPTGAIVESVTMTPGGSVEKEDVRDGDGALHTVLIFDNRCDEAQVVIIGKAYTKKKGELDGSASAFEVVDVSVEHGRGALRTTVSLRKVKFT
jgi:hypothetical protein